LRTDSYWAGSSKSACGQGRTIADLQTSKVRCRDLTLCRHPIHRRRFRSLGAGRQGRLTTPAAEYSGRLWPELSPRECGLVQFVLAGHPTATIAERLGITVGTAKNHRSRIYEKLDITTEQELYLQFSSTAWQATESDHETGWATFLAIDNLPPQARCLSPSP
jgi:DNA-binding CsgD family transcriptional regulator